MDPVTEGQGDEALTKGGAGWSRRARGRSGRRGRAAQAPRRPRADAAWKDPGRDRGGGGGVGVQRPQRPGAQPGPGCCRRFRTGKQLAAGQEKAKGRRAPGRAKTPARPGITPGQQEAGLPVLPDTVPRAGERALARWGLLGEAAAPVFTPKALLLAGRPLALPALEATGCWPAPARRTGSPERVIRPRRNTAPPLMFLALLREPRAEGATRIPPARWAGCWAWTGPRRSRRSCS